MLTGFHAFALYVHLRVHLCVCVLLTLCAIWLTQGEVQLERSGPLEFHATGDDMH